MFYTTADNNHGLPHNPFKAIVSPRPIAWISTQDKNGVTNLAPYSFFNAISDAPPMIMFTNTGAKSDVSYGKDTTSNIKETGEFVVNIVSYDLRDQMNISAGSYENEVDEFEKAGLTKAASQIVKPPYVSDAPAALECKLYDFIDLPGENIIMVLGTVVGVHLNDAYIKDGIFDVTQYAPLARLGYRDYAKVSEVFPLVRPE